MNAVKLDQGNGLDKQWGKSQQQEKEEVCIANLIQKRVEMTHQNLQHIITMSTQVHADFNTNSHQTSSEDSRSKKKRLLGWEENRLQLPAGHSARQQPLHSNKTTLMLLLHRWTVSLKYFEIKLRQTQTIEKSTSALAHENINQVQLANNKISL